MRSAPTFWHEGRARWLPGRDSAAPGFVFALGRVTQLTATITRWPVATVMDNTSPAGNTGSQIPQAEKHRQAHADRAYSEPRKIDATPPGYLLRSYETWKQLDPAQSAVSGISRQS